ncbi:MAG: DUF4080 domain-containing protein [Clostridia bacterium]|nr:DUF4080 domain-containing protein [Clostridia bacterium]
MKKLKAVFCSINSKYIHSSLSVWYLFTSAKKLCKEEFELSVVEGTINENEDEIIKRLLDKKPDLIAFSTYIWNIKTVLSVSEKIKTATPKIKILLGGPEVSFNQKQVLSENPFVDFISSGEGEKSVPLLLNALSDETDTDLKGISYRKGDSITVNEGEVLSIEDIPSPYCEEYFQSLKNRIAYIESSRGCPFGCAFCLSGKEGKVRFFDLTEVKENMLSLVNHGAKTVKFVDRTFNCNKEHAKEILTFIKENHGGKIPSDVCFHFEIAADIMSEDLFEIISALPKGSVQFEVGIQSFNENTLRRINRKTNLKKVTENIERLLSFGNCHIHIDLIAGLPEEDFSSFKESFNKAYELKADMLQLGFLKILHGSPMSEQRELYPCEYSFEPPYEVISTPWINADELKLLHKCENELERLYNSGRFSRTLSYVLAKINMQPFDLFIKMADFLLEKGEKGSIPLDKYTNLAFEFFSSLEGVDRAVLRDKMLFDRITTNNSDVIPEALKVEDKKLSKVKKAFAKLYPPKKGEKRTVAILYTENKAVLVRYENKNPVSGEYPFTECRIDELLTSAQ